MVGDRIKAMLADKGYDADAFRDALVAEGIEPVIPPKRNRKVAIDYDRELYKQRNLIERMFNKLKNWRRVATRYRQISRVFPRLRLDRRNQVVATFCPRSLNRYRGRFRLAMS